jgi:hypothetical protein
MRNLMVSAASFAVSITSSFSSAWAQGQGEAAPPPPPPPPLNPSTGGNLLDFFSHKTPYEFWLTCIIIAFGIIVLAFLFVGVKRLPADRRTEDYSRALIVITVVTAALILITAGYSDRQSAPAFGLLGTIIGYVLGRMGQPRTEPGGDAAPGAPQPAAGPEPPPPAPPAAGPAAAPSST